MQEQLLALIRYSLGGPLEPILTTGSIDWRALFEESKRQCIAGITYAGVERLSKLDPTPPGQWTTASLEKGQNSPKEALPLKGEAGIEATFSKPPMKLLLDWIGEARKNEKQLKAFHSVIAELHVLLSNANIQYVVFKGAAVASHYPRPDMRTMGDVDFYVPDWDFSRAMSLLEKEWGVDIKKDDIDKHYSFNYQGIRFEMHYQMETFGASSHQRYFSELIDNSLRQHDVSSFETSGMKVPMLNPELDLLLVFKHWTTHLIGEGVGLRQTIDLAVLIREYQEQIDVTLLREHLSAIGYLRAFDAVVAMCEDYFATSWPAYWKAASVSVPEVITEGKAKAKAKVLLKQVCENGNFGRSDYKHTEGSAKRAETTWRFFRHCWTFFPLAPKDIACMVPKRILISIKAH